MKFTPIQVAGRPYSLPIASGVVLERGQGLYLDTNGAVTDVNGATVKPIGLCDDVQTNPERYQVVNEVHSVAVTSATGAFSVAVNLDHTAVDLGTVLASDDLVTAGVASLTIAGVVVATGTVKVSGAANGVVTIASTVNTLADGAYTAVLTISYAYIMTDTAATLGYSKQLDMFNNNSTQASKLCTVWFGEGVYETDAFDPYVVYTPGAAVYIKNGGYLTTTSGANAAAIKIGQVIKAPATNYTPEQSTVYNHLGAPEMLRILLRVEKA